MDEIKTGSLENPLVETFPLTSTAPIASPKALGCFDYIPVKIMSHLALMNPPYFYTRGGFPVEIIPGRLLCVQNAPYC